MDGFLSMTIASSKSNVSSQQITTYVSAGVDITNNYSDIFIINDGYIVVATSNATSGNAVFSVFASKYLV
jgi:hypothetical protein